MQTCPKCKANNVGDAVFCIQCGANLHAPTVAPLPAPAKPAFTGPSRVIVTDIDMPFGSMMSFMLKWFFASIPVLIMIGIGFVIAGTLFAGCVAAMGRGLRPQ
jgi:hypothetical protein